LAGWFERKLSRFLVG
jgi:hypothetical protein